MKKILSFISATAFAFVVLKGTAVPTKFCQGVREEDGQEYGAFIDSHAIPTNDQRFKYLNPEDLARISASVATTWKTNVRTGQKALCGKASF